MLRYSLKRMFLMVPILFGITLLSFTIMHMAPGGPQPLDHLCRMGAQLVGEL